VSNLFIKLFLEDSIVFTINIIRFTNTLVYNYYIYKVSNTITIKIVDNIIYS